MTSQCVRSTTSGSSTTTLACRIYIASITLAIILLAVIITLVILHPQVIMTSSYIHDVIEINNSRYAGSTIPLLLSLGLHSIVVNQQYTHSPHEISKLSENLSDSKSSSRVRTNKLHTMSRYLIQRTTSPSTISGRPTRPPVTGRHRTAARLNPAAKTTTKATTRGIRKKSQMVSKKAHKSTDNTNIYNAVARSIYDFLGHNSIRAGKVKVGKESAKLGDITSSVGKLPGGPHAVRPQSASRQSFVSSELSRWAAKSVEKIALKSSIVTL